MNRLLSVLFIFGVLTGVNFSFAQTSAPVWHQADLQQASADNGNAVVNRPTNVAAGNLIIVVLSDRDNPTITAPAGFNEIIRVTSGSTDQSQVAAYWKIATASEPTTYTFTRSTNRHWRASAVRVTGFNPNFPIGKTSGNHTGNAEAANITVTGFNTTNNNALVVGAFATHNTISAVGTPAGMTQRWANNTPRPGNGGFTQVFPTQGATGDKTFTWTTNRRRSALLFEINGIPNPTTAPGGVFGSVVWLKADAGTSTTTDGAAITQWNDASGNGTHATQTTNAPQFRIGSSAQGVNFNPSVSFNGTNNFFNLPSGFVNFTSGATAYSVLNGNFGTAQNWGRLFHLSTGGNANMLSFNRNSNTNNIGFEVWNASGQIGSLWTTNNPLATSSGSNILGYRIQAGTSGQTNRTANMYFNGASQNSTSTAATPTTVNRTLNRIGYGNGNEYINGYTPEIILYNNDLTAAERLRVDSYLAIKYGVTLNQSSPQNYVASNGTTVFWNATTNAGYNTNIAGIVRDDVSALNQKQSQSINAGLQIAMGNGNTIAATNQANTQNFSANLSGLMWGDNNGSLAAWTSTGAPAGYQIVPRNWRVQETGTVGSVRIRVPDNSAVNGLPNTGGAPVSLIINNSNNFSSGSTIIPMTLVGTNWEANVDFTTGQYFTFGACDAVTVSFNLGSTSSRCQGAGSVTYTATAMNATGVTYSLDAASLAAGNTINQTTGQVTYIASWSGQSTITVNAVGCTNASANHVVTTTPNVTTPVFDSGATSQRCRAAGTVTYTATAQNTTGINYSLDAASLAGGNSINASTGAVTFVSTWSGVSIITASAAGCNGPVTATHQVSSSAIFAVNDEIETFQGVPISFNVINNDLCDINPASVTIVSNPSGGFIQQGTNGIFTYVSFGAFQGIDQFQYQVCSNGPNVVCQTATVIITVNDGVETACFRANKNLIYYLPFPENESQLRQSLLSAASVNNLTANVRNVTTIAITYPGTVIVYDHWEDGYESLITVPSQSTTQVWGDGNLTNGVAPGYPNDIIPAGGIITLDQSFAWDRPLSQIQYDGKDKLYSTSELTVAKVTGDAGSTGGTPLFNVQNVKTNVFDVSTFGQFFVMPFGENVTLGGTTAFRYTGLFVRASEDGTIVELDLDGNGTTDVVSPTLNEGQVWFYNGTAGTPGVNPGDVNTALDIKAGARVISNKDVGVDLVFGGIDNYGTRNTPVLPSQFYGSSYFSPVYSTNTDAPVYGYFVNPNPTQITINWTRSSGSPLSGNFTVPANNGISFFNMNVASGTKFQSAGGESFTAIGIVDADASGAAFDWAFSLIPESQLTNFASVAWAPGSSNLSGNYNPVWVTPTANTTVYVRYNGNLNAGPNQSPCGLHYDVAYNLNALQSQLITNPSNDNTGLAVFTCNETPISAIWGLRPFGGTPTASPALDVGYTMIPKCLGELVFATFDVVVTLSTTPVDINVSTNDGTFLCTLDPQNVTILAPPANGTVVVNPNGTITYTPVPGYLGPDVFEYQICATSPQDYVCDNAFVYITVTDAFTPDANTICGAVYADVDLDGIPSLGDWGVGGISINLFEDTNQNGVLDLGEPLVQTVQSSNGADIGFFQFTIQQNYTYRDEFNTNGNPSGNNGTLNWTNNWTKIGETSNFSSNNIRVISNQLRIQGNGNSSQIGATRSANLSAASSALLSLDFDKSEFSNLSNDWVDLQISSNGSAPWSTLKRYDGLAAATGSDNFNITPWMGSNTTIRFVESSNNNFSTSERVFFDNVQIQYFTDNDYIVQLASPIANNWNLNSSPSFYSVPFSGLNNSNCVNTFGLIKTDIEVNKTIDNPTPVAGNLVTFTIAASNNGATDDINVVVVDQLPSGYLFDDFQASIGGYDSGTGIWTIGTLSVGATEVLNITAMVLGSGDYLNVASISGDIFDVNLSNNSSSVMANPLFATAINDINQTQPNVEVTGNVLTNDLYVTQVTDVSQGFINIPLGTPTAISSGTITINADGTYTFVPAPGFVGTVPVISYTAANANNTSLSNAALTIQVILPFNPGVNNYPIANPITATAEQGQTVSIDALSNSTDLNGDVVALTSIAGLNITGNPLTLTGTPQNVYNENGDLTGQASVSGDNLVFTPDANYTGTVPFVYVINDGNGSTATSTITVTITPDAPDAIYANDDAISAPQGETMTGSVLNNDQLSGTNPAVSSAVATFGGTNYPLTIGSATTIPGVGDVTLNADGSYTFDPLPGFVGTLPVAYTVCNAENYCGTATLYATSVAPAQVVAQDDINQTQPNTPTSGDVLTNDDNATQVTAATQGMTNIPLGTPTAITGGTITINADGTYTFVPAPGFEGTVPAITTTVANANNTSSATSTLTIEVVSPFNPGVNNYPIANPITATAEQGQTASINALSNSTDLNGDVVALTSIAGLDNAGNPLTLTGTPQNVYNENGDLTGQASVSGDNLVFTPDANYTGTVPFVYVINDGNGSTATSTITVTITPDAPDAVYANDDAISAPQGETMTGNVLDNDQLEGTNPEVTTAVATLGGTDYPLTIGSATTIPGVGDVTMNADGTYTFDPLPGFVGTLPVAYTVCNAENNCGTATLYATSVAPAQVVAQDDINQTQPNTPTSGYVLTNDDNATQVTAASQGATNIPLGTPTAITGGTITINADGTYTFVPAPGFEGTVPAITTTVANANNTSSATSTLTIEVVSPFNPGANNDPIANPITATAEQGQTASINALSNSSDLDGNTVALTSIAGLDNAGNPLTLTGTPQNVYNENGDLTGQASVSGDNLVFTPDANYTGTVPFVYVINDGNGSTATSTITVTVTPSSPDAVYANDDAISAPQGETMTGNVLDNDQLEGTNPEVTTAVATLGGTDYPLTIGSATTIPGVGDVTLNADGSYTFDPLPDFVGTLPVAYTVCNAENNCGTATLYVTSVAPAQVVAQDDINQTQANIPTSGNVLTNDENATQVTAFSYIDGDGDPQTHVFAVDGPFEDVYIQGGTLTFNTDGSYSFEPEFGFVGSLPTIVYTAANATNSSSSSADLNIEVIAPYITGQNNNPVANPITATAQQGETVNVFALSTSSDIDGDAITLTTITGLNNAGNPLTLTGTPQNVYNSNGVLAGQASVSGNNLVFTPALNYVGDVPFGYEIEDGNGGSASSTINVTVVPSTPNAIYANDDANAAPIGVSMIGNVLTNDQLSGTNPAVSSAVATIGGIDYPLTIGSATNIPGVGTVTLNANGSYTFSPLQAFVGTLPVAYTVCNDNNICSSATLYLTSVTGLPDLTPTVVLDNFSFNAGDSFDAILDVFEINSLSTGNNSVVVVIPVLSAYDITVPGLTLTNVNQQGISGTSNVDGGLPNDNGNWLFKQTPSFIIITRVPGVPIDANSVSSIGLNFSIKPTTLTDSVEQFTILVAPLNGGENSFENNVVEVTFVAN